jgi:hypothetical protein
MTEQHVDRILHSTPAIVLAAAAFRIAILIHSRENITRYSSLYRVLLSDAKSQLGMRLPSSLMNKRAGWEDEATTRAINAKPWEPMAGMVKRQCPPQCRYWFARSSEQNHRTTLPGLRGKAVAKPAETSVKVERRPSIRSRG